MLKDVCSGACLTVQLTLTAMNRELIDRRLLKLVELLVPISTCACGLYLKVVRTKGSSPLPELPHEVWDVVIDHLHDDKSALLACRCVCRAWHPSSRYYLRGHIRLQAPFVWPSTLDAVTDYQNDTDILARIPPHKHISSLRIEWNCTCDIHRIDNLPLYQECMHNSLSRAVQAMPHLVSLTLIGIQLRYSGHPHDEEENSTHVLEAVLQLPRFRELTLLGVELTEQPPMSHLSLDINLTPYLQKLCIRES